MAKQAMLAARLQVSGGRLTGTTATVTPAPPCSRYSLRARDPSDLEAVIGQPLPRRIGDTENGIACLGPDEWYALLPEGATLPATATGAMAVVDVSARAVGINVDGPGGVALLTAGCPLDLERMAPGRATRTVYETVEIVVWRESQTRFRVEVWRSFAPWLWQALAVSLD